MPGMGRTRSFKHKDLAGLRSWKVEGFSNYLIFYFARPNGVEILRVIHGARNIYKIFNAEAEE